MKNTIYSVITGTGSYIPPKRIQNENFLHNEFYDTDGTKLKKTNQEIVDKFLEITTIAERRYVADDLVTSDIAYYAAVDAIKSARIDQEDLDYVIVAHNFGDVRKDNKQVDIVPSLAARVKHKLEIKNPYAVAYDLPFGCPGWLQAVIQADYFIKSGDAKKVLVIGAEVLSRVSDPHDRDSMLYADGAGAIVLEARESDTPVGILAHKTRSDAYLYSQMLYMDKSYKPDSEHKDDLFLKMNGRKLYQYALETVPQAIKACLEKNGTHLSEVKKVLIHQANGKMDDAILSRLYGLYDMAVVPDDIMPMTISWLGNSSVATVPTLLDLLLKDKLDTHKINKGDTLVFASVGAGMNVNAMIYKM
ncbi:3-oxoacyl-[acyl-carrier-protein] synthase-3 [Pontibacter ummariensis]|uniref:3-oxoacyl-[acyl-carrier-protein] synthase-3 n=1 Tax=Pontibacter ummariensis TaxID=1610492 RepID=A0A239DZA6_9BACT|nr:ketoacyl-ACP synthase III [Pontibacter ummariensis]PRY13708.1 3-oxoacyl-[acyl-carrier-protein] synthase-3 [Pontibacter ummariensis]SNS37053.1 3-oxoacyl-[acyl-carrier-protein] synthase-3 [Pontibacter ummariensis]